jgi:hypothetical protein
MQQFVFPDHKYSIDTLRLRDFAHSVNALGTVWEIEKPLYLEIISLLQEIRPLAKECIKRKNVSLTLSIIDRLFNVAEMTAGSTGYLRNQVFFIIQEWMMAISATVVPKSRQVCDRLVSEFKKENFIAIYVIDYLSQLSILNCDCIELFKISYSLSKKDFIAQETARAIAKRLLLTHEQLNKFSNLL